MERRCKTFQKQKILFSFFLVILLMLCLIGRLLYLMVGKAEDYGQRAKEVQQRQRVIKGKRGKILDRRGLVLAGNVPVSTVSVIHNQITDAPKVIKSLSTILQIDRNEVRKRVEKVSSIEKIKSNVSKEQSDRLRALNLDGVMVDEDYKRYYPYGSFASRVIGFTGADNQGIIGLEAQYDSLLAGKNGAILTTTNARGIEIDGKGEQRVEPIDGKNLYTSLDYTLQSYAWQTAKKVRKAKKAASVRIIMMNPNSGEIYAMVNEPEFNLEKPFSLIGKEGKKQDSLSEKKENELLNRMWRNPCISDTYEPGSTFKIVTATTALEQGKATLGDTFFCPGFKMVEDRRIRCHKVKGHGSENFVEAVQNSCNPAFMEIGARVGVSGMYRGMKRLGILQNTGVDLPGEACTIMHQKKNVKAVELATISFGQSFQLSPIRLLTSISSVINGGKMITPHFGVGVEYKDKKRYKKLTYKEREGVVSKETSENMKMILESVVSKGSGGKAAVEGYTVGAKTGTSEKLPRGTGKYIASCVGFAPADHPKLLAIVLIDEPQGIYYGGTIAAPVISELLDNALPYLDIPVDS